jgi:exopolysaccharide biosynthesis protein
MNQFTYKINGQEYSVPDTLLSNTVTAITTGDNLFSRDTLRVLAAKEAFFKAINAEMFKDSSRSYHHYLTINGQVVWEHDWREEPKGDFDYGDFLEKLAEYLMEIGLVDNI